METPKKSALAASLFAMILVVGACGGVNLDATARQGTQEGVFSDAAVAGLEYLTSSGVRGVTDSSGRYRFNPGDTVEFKIGALTLGFSATKELLTPLDLAGDDHARLQNLLVVLQSLDHDGDPSNGIAIPMAAAAALPALDLSVALNPVAVQDLQAAMQAGGITAPVRTVEEADGHFLEQAPALLSRHVWVATQGSGAGRKPLSAMHMMPGPEDVALLLGEVAAAERGGGAGVEYGRVKATAVDGRGFKVEASLGVDTLGEAGFSHGGPGDRLGVSGDTLKVGGAERELSFSRMDNDPEGIVGAWMVADTDGEPMAGSPMLLFFANGRLMVVDPAEGEHEDSCGGPGVETGRYAYDDTTRWVTASGAEVDTNGCAGIFKDGAASGFRFELREGGKIAQIAQADDPMEATVTWARVSNGRRGRDATVLPAQSCCQGEDTRSRLSTQRL